MAKIMLGPMVGQVSGSVGGTTFSRNRYGTYIRRRAHPTTSQSGPSMQAKNALGTISRAWSLLTDDERVAWATWAANNPVTDKLGQKQVLSANAAYMRINGRLMAAECTELDLPPVSYAPPALETATLVADVGAGGVSLAFTGTPLAAGHRIWLRAAVSDGSSQGYVKNKLRFLGVSAAALASPMLSITLPTMGAGTLMAALEARFGTLAGGQLVTVYASVFDDGTGLLSTPIVAGALVTSTGVPTTLAVTITPVGAIENGAMWSVDAGVTWYDSAKVVAMIAGAKTVTFHASDGYTTPEPLAKTVVVHTANAASQAYTEE